MDEDGMDTRDDREFAWRVHDAQELWIGKVDVKASMVLAFEAAVLVLAVTNDDLRSLIRGSDLWNRLLGIGGIALLLAAVVCVGAAVWPVTGRIRVLRDESAQHLIYFGHVRYISAADLGQRLKTLTNADELAMLSQQIVRCSHINWWKHRMIQCSLVFAFSGLAALSALVVLGTFR
jgi:hypothetical protein